MIVALAACGGASTITPAPTPTASTATTSAAIIVPPRRPVDGHVWVIGFAQMAKAGPIVQTEFGPVYLGDRKEWPAEWVGRPVIVDGTLKTEHHGSMETADGAAMAGIPGDQLIVTPSTAPPLADDGLLEAERELVKAFERRDRAALELMVSASFQLHISGRTNVRTRDDMLTSMLVPEIEKVDVSQLQSHRSGAYGVVTGLQVAKVRDKGALIDDPTYFVDVFEHHDNRWVLTTAYAK